MVGKKRTGDQQEDGGFVLPRSLTIKDVITITSVCISITLAWGVFGTRITLLEKEVLSVRELNTQNAQIIDQLRSQIRQLESKQQDDQLLIDDLFRSQHKPLPRRSSGY